MGVGPRKFSDESLLSSRGNGGGGGISLGGVRAEDVRREKSENLWSKAYRSMKWDVISVNFDTGLRAALRNGGQKKKLTGFFSLLRQKTRLIRTSQEYRVPR